MTLSEKEQRLLDEVLADGQEHLADAWAQGGEAAEDGKKRLAAQLVQLDEAYPGGLLQYIRNARRLLADSREGKNAFDGYVPSVPEGEKLDYASDACNELETLGVEAAAEAAFVLVAGGLGERLGYSGIKVALPSDSARGACFLQLYIENILALEAKAKAAGRGTGGPLPLAIMTSDDTHARTQQLLEEHGYFGGSPAQVHLIKQEKARRFLEVPCLADGDARLAVDPEDPFRIQTKPHGHGDVHALLHSSGLAAQWAAAGINWLCFFQDTNGLVFRALPAALGVSVRNAYDVNSLAVPRRAREAIGAIALLKNERTGHKMTINVEYNQLDPLLRATINPEGDVNDDTGFSPFPGNINQLVLRLEPYVKQLQASGGLIAEFVNPKYRDDTRTAFKSATRLECMMQDYPKELPSTARVGFTVINQVWAAYSPVKNSAADAVAKVAAGLPSHSATTGELDQYGANCRMLRAVGAQVADARPAVFNNLHVELWPRVSWTPFFAQTVAELRDRLLQPGSVRLGQDATLVLDVGNVQLKALELNGALRVSGAAEAQVVIDGLAVRNAGWRWRPLEQGEQALEEEAMRGFRVEKDETRDVVCEEALLYYVRDAKTSSAPLEQAAVAR